MDHHFYHSDYRTVSPYWVLPVYVELIRAVLADATTRWGRTGHYYFDEMRSSFNLVENHLFALTKLNIYKTNWLNLSNCTSSSAEKGNMK
jgi:hypothetical protein